MKKLPLYLKIIFTIVAFLTVTYAIITFFFNLNFNFTNDITQFTLMILNSIFLLILAFRIYSFKEVGKDTRLLWILLIVFISPSVFIYIWSIDDKFVNERKK